MAIELTSAPLELLRDIRVTLGGAGLSGDELIRGFKTFNQVLSASNGILAANDTTVENLSVLGNFIFKQTTFETISAQDARIAKDLTANELRIPGSSVFNDVNVVNDTLVQNLTVNGNFVSDAAKFYTPPSNAFILYDSQFPEIIILTPSSINYTPKIIKTRGLIDFSDSLLQTNRTFEGNIAPSRTDNTLFVVDGIDVLRGSLSFFNQPSLQTLTLTGFKQVNSILIQSVPLIKECNFPLLEAVNGNLNIIDPGPFQGTPLNLSLTGVFLPELKYVANALSIGGYAFFGDSNSSISEINLNKLEFCPFINIRAANILRTLRFPLLDISTGGLTFEFMRDLRRLEFPILQQASSFTVQSLNNLRDLNFPELQLRIGGYITVQANCGALTGVQLPKLVNNTPPYFRTNFAGASALRKLNFGFHTLRTFGGEFFAECSLDTATTTSILSTLLQLDGTGGKSFYNDNVFLSGFNEPPTFVGGITKMTAASNFSKTNEIVTVNYVNHGFNDQDIVTFEAATSDFFVVSGCTGTYRINVTSPNQFTYSHRATGFYTHISTVPGDVIMRTTTDSNDGYRFYQLLDIRASQWPPASHRLVRVAQPPRPPGLTST